MKISVLGCGVVVAAVTLLPIRPGLAEEKDTKGVITHFPQQGADRVPSQPVERAADIVIDNLTTIHSAEKSGNADGHGPAHASP